MSDATPLSLDAPARPQTAAAVACPVVAFDFDGTLADTTEAIWTTVEATLEALSLGPASRTQLLPLIGLPLAQAFAGLGIEDGHLQACTTTYRGLFPRYAASVRLFPRVHECLTELAKRGVSLAVVSSRGRRSLGELLSRLELRHHFAAVFADEDAVNKKPAPDLVHLVARHFGVSPGQILVVGDTTYDIEMGHAAGARTCAVTFGNHDWQRLSVVRPHHRVDCIGELCDLVLGLVSE